LRFALDLESPVIVVTRAKVSARVSQIGMYATSVPLLRVVASRMT
jgi:hypothetical protein